jgi:PAS domain-containing protein
LTQLELVIPLRRTAPDTEGGHLHPGLVPWRAAVCASTDACMLLSAETRIAAASPAAREMLGLALETETVKPRFLDCGLRFLDFTSGAQPLQDAELARLAPVQALQTDALERGLIRLDLRGAPRTFDVVASPLHSPPQLDAIGALAFFTPVGPG